MGLFDRFKQGLTRTREKVSAGFRSVLRIGQKIDEDGGWKPRILKTEAVADTGVAETLDWAGALTELDVVALDPATVSDTLGALLKYQDDIARLDGTKVKALLDEVKSELRAAE